MSTHDSGPSTPLPQPVLRVHPTLTLFPARNVEDFESLKANMARYGQPVTILVNNAMVVDGKDMLKACIELGIEPVLMDWDGSEPAHHFIVTTQIDNRHYSDDQRTMIALMSCLLWRLRPWSRESSQGGATAEPTSVLSYFDDAADVVDVHDLFDEIGAIAHGA